MDAAELKAKGMLLSYALDVIHLRRIKQDWLNKPYITSQNPMLDAEQAKQEIYADWRKLMAETDKEIIVELAMQYMLQRTDKTMLHMIKATMAGTQPDDIFAAYERQFKLHLGPDFVL